MKPKKTRKKNDKPRGFVVMSKKEVSRIAAMGGELPMEVGDPVRNHLLRP